MDGKRCRRGVSSVDQMFDASGPHSAFLSEHGGLCVSASARMEKLIWLDAFVSEVRFYPSLCVNNELDGLTFSLNLYYIEICKATCHAELCTMPKAATHSETINEYRFYSFHIHRTRCTYLNRPRHVQL